MMPIVQQVADAWWARDFGCSPMELRPERTRVQPHTGDLQGNDGIWILVVGEFPVVSLPPRLVPLLEERARQWSRSVVSSPQALLAEVAPVPVARVVGPAFIGYATEETLVRPAGPAARRLIASDRTAVEELRAACTTEEWEHGGSRLESVPTFGSFDDAGRLSALAGYEVWNDQIAHISVVSASNLRSHGFGTAVAGLAAESALAYGLLPQYRTLVSNAASMRVAEKLGFKEYGFSVYIKPEVA